MKSSRSPFEVLGVSQSSSIAECKKAYRKLCLLYHPDSETADIELFNEVKTAWETINNPSLVARFKPRVSLTHVSLFNFSVKIS